MSARQPVLELHPEEFFQVAAVGYRRGKFETEFLLVRTGSGRWTFPKGHVEPALGARRSAQREAREEAGAFGAMDDFPFGAYCATKNGKGGCPSEFLVYTYLLHITQQGEPAETGRDPLWVTAAEARTMLRWGRSEPYATQVANVIDLALATIAGRAAEERVAGWRPVRPALGNLYEIS
jgi:8-oxo-dGTP pyrophosphatase MutT (NUDIX family)